MVSWIQWPRPGDIVRPIFIGSLHRRLDDIPAVDKDRPNMDASVLGDSRTRDQRLKSQPSKSGMVRPGLS